MPVIADPDEPPAKCCKFCEETKCNVDGEPISWRLTLDQDLIDTLKESFPDWFQQTEIKSSNQEPIINIDTINNNSNNTTIEKFSNNNYNLNNNNLIQAGPINDNSNNFANSSSITILNCVTCELVDKNINCTTAAKHKTQQYKKRNVNNGLITQHLNELNGNQPLLTLTTKILSKSSNPDLSINSGYSLNAKSFLATSKKSTSKRYCHITSVPLSNTKVKANYLRTFASSVCSASPESVPSFIPLPISYPSSSILSLSQSPILNLKTFHNDRQLFLLNDSIVTTPFTKATITAATSATTGPTSINNNSTTISQTSIATAPAPVSAPAPVLSLYNNTGEHYSSNSDPLLATFSDSVTFQILSDSCSYNHLLTASTFSTSAAHSFLRNLAFTTPVKHTCEDNILLQKICKRNMSEEEQQQLNVSLLTGKDVSSSGIYDARQSPPKAFVDSTPLQPAMDKNKESLKVKLMVRRPHSQLVEQGIIPPLKTSPAIHEQCRQLERAKTSDLLKAKIQQRPNREDLERRHILEEDECHIDPSLAEKQRMLKKARLADQLNSQIQHRPGPLELIKKNILHTEKPIEKIVKEGLVTFKATSEGLLTRPQHPNSYVTIDEESVSSESDSLRQTPSCVNECVSTTISNCANADIHTTTAFSQTVATPLIVPISSESVFPKSPNFEKLSNQEESKHNYVSYQISSTTPTTFKVTQETANLYEELCQSVAGSSNNYLSVISSLPSTSCHSTVSTYSSMPSVVSSALSYSGTLKASAVPSSGIQIAKSDAPGKDKNRKKLKSKQSSKARTIKFHEYKGPPSASNKNSIDTSLTTEETSYQLMLEQQNCLLKFLETLNKNQSILPAGNNGPSALVANVTATSTGSKSASTIANNVITPISNSNNSVSQTISTSSNTSTPMQGIVEESQTHSTNHEPIVLSSSNNNNCTSRPSNTISPALSITSIPLSPAANYGTSIIDLTKLEKMKVSDLKVHLKRRNLPVSGSKSQLIERLKLYIPLEPLENNNTNSIQSVSIKEVEKEMSVEAMDTNTEVISTQHDKSEGDQINTVTQIDSLRSNVMPTHQPETTTIIFSNEELLKEQQRKIDELQKQLQKSQQELQEIRQKQQQHMVNQKFHQESIPNGLTTQQVALITTSKPAQTPHTVAVLHPQINETATRARVTLKAASTVKTIAMPTLTKDKKDNQGICSSAIKQTNNTAMMSQKMVVKQHLEAKIQKQAAAAAAAAAAQAQAQANAQILNSQSTYQLHSEAQKTHIRCVLIPTETAVTTAKSNAKVKSVRNAKNSQPIAVNAPSEILTKQIQVPITRPHNNLSLVWNEGNQTIFLVGLNDQHMTPPTMGGNISLVKSNESNKRFFNSQQCTNSIANVTFPVSRETISNQNIVIRPSQEQATIIQAKQYLNAQHVQQKQQKKIQTHFDHLIEQQQRLDITPMSPLKYGENVKHLQDNTNNNEQKPLAMLNPLIKIKEECLSITDSQNEQQQQQQEYQSSVIDDHVIKSEKLTDVLDILVKQGDLPESALVPTTTADKSLILNDNNALINNINDDVGMDQQTQLTSNNYINQINKINMDKNNQISRINSTMMQLSPTQSQNIFNSFYKSLNTSAPIPSTNSNTFDSNFMQNINTTSTKSFPSSSLNENTTNLNKTLYTFLNDEQQISDNNCGDQHNNSDSCANDENVSNIEGKQTNLTINSPMVTATQTFPSISNSDNRTVALDHLSNNDAKLDHFDEFELLELMSQQLEMDIGETSELDPHTLSIGKFSNNQMANQFHHPNIKVNSNDSSCTNNVTGFRRSMNPSMQPSLTELMDNNACIGNANNSSCYHQDTNSNNANEKFPTENLNQFNPATLIQSNDLSPPSLSSQEEEQQSNNLINNNQFLSIQMNSENNIIPMDVCEDFDNTLNDFNFPSSTTNIDSLQQSTSAFDQFDLSSTSENVISSLTIKSTPTSRFGTILQDSNSSTTTINYIQPNNEEMSICSTSLSDNGVTSHNDTFCSMSTDLFDLFNMDDYKMAWSEGDFVV